MVRAKFLCNRVETFHTGTRDGVPVFSHTYDFIPVYSSDKTSENYTFWEATPSGSLKMQCVRGDLFKVGETYYLDFTVAPRN